jgi:hypothetical protein
MYLLQQINFRILLASKLLELFNMEILIITIKVVSKSKVKATLLNQREIDQDKLLK